MSELQNITVAEKCLLVTIDANLLYMSIVQKDGLKGVKKALHEHRKLKQEQIAFILKGLEMAMERNYFYIVT